MLKIATHNVQSITNQVKRHQLIQSMIHYNLNILDISETNLTIKQSWHFARSLDPSYHYYLSSGDCSKGAGIGLIVRPLISSHIFNHFLYKGRFIYINLQVKGKTKLHIFQVYLYASNYDIKEWLQV